jgi:hypothetical protein
LLQDHLDVPVQAITWGHPNLGREFREHQINIFAREFLKIGFSFEHKQKLLEEFASQDANDYPNARYEPCPGMRKERGKKPVDPDEANADRLDPRLLSHHFDAYWQICKALGCTRMPETEAQLALEFVEDKEES